MQSIFHYRSTDTAAAGSSPLQGVRVAIQPNVSVQDWPTDAGSRALENFIALEDATIIRRLRKAGVVLCGSTRMSEFGFGMGGSRAGEALTANEADAEIVLDLMGECRLAAAKAGICGFKPSYGLVSSLGLIGLIPSMECWGLLSAELERVREIMGTIAGPDPLDFSLPDQPAPDFSEQAVEPENMSIGLIPEAQSGLSDDRNSAFQVVLEELKQAGFSLREFSLPDLALFSLVHNISGSVEASSCTGRYDSVRYGRRAQRAKNWNEMFLRSRGAAFGSLVKSFLIQGTYFQFEDYVAYEDACRIRARLVADMQKLFDQTDFLIFPASSGSLSSHRPFLADCYKQFASTLFANVTGQPALYLPPAPGSNAEGFQLAGPRLSDARLIALGEYLLNLWQGGNG